MQLQSTCWIALAGSWLLLAAPARADLLASLNQLRFKECAPSSPLPALHRSSGLDAVAQEWSRGGRLAEAIARTTYRGYKLASMQVRGVVQNAKVVAALREHYCSILTDARYSEVGMFLREDGAWIVVAAPVSLPSRSDATQIRQRVLDLVNAARSQPRKCGSNAFDAAKPLRAAAELDSAAQAQAQDMAQHLFFRHQGSDGSSPGQRATRAGYRWSVVGENIAAGMSTPEEAMEGWLASPGHCANIMEPQFTEMGLAYAITDDAKPNIYWSQLFALPRQP